jgi:hypothetical protein
LNEAAWSCLGLPRRIGRRIVCKTMMTLLAWSEAAKNRKYLARKLGFEAVS